MLGRRRGTNATSLVHCEPPDARSQTRWRNPSSTIGLGLSLKVSFFCGRARVFEHRLHGHASQSIGVSYSRHHLRVVRLDPICGHGLLLSGSESGLLCDRQRHRVTARVTLGAAIMNKSARVARAAMYKGRWGAERAPV